MSDQNLREAVQMLREDLTRSYPGRAQYDMASTTIDRLDSMLAAHPVAPAFERAPVQVEITDEAVAAAAQVFYGGAWLVPDGEMNALLKQGARAALEAAAPLLGPRPLLDRDALGRALVSFGADVRLDPSQPAEMFGIAVDAVMELARPMPTRKQIAAILHDQHAGHEWGSKGCQRAGSNCAKRYLRNADAVLALLNGAES